MLGFTRAVAKELIVQGIRVNAVAPGFLESAGAGIDESGAARRRSGSGRRSGASAAAEEIAGTVAFLASDDAGFFVGETLSPNGGLVTT